MNTYFAKNLIVLGLLFACLCISCKSTHDIQTQNPKFKVIAFYTAQNDQAHISFVNEANIWWAQMAEKHLFSYETTTNWENMTPAFLEQYQVVLFLDTRPETTTQRNAFRHYMENGGSWMGFHFSGFALTPSSFPQNWDWYHLDFLGSGAYKGNTWRPTSAILKNEAPKHPALKNVPMTFTSQPNEWYSWEKDLRANPDIQILLSIDASSYPLGTGPKPHEIWHSGYYPVVWTNSTYKMLYVNMGHNDIDYENGTNETLSNTFDNPIQNQLFLNALFWLGTK